MHPWICDIFNPNVTDRHQRFVGQFSLTPYFYHCKTRGFPSKTIAKSRSVIEQSQKSRSVF